MAMIVELEVERIFTDGLLGEDTSIQDQLNARALAGWMLKGVLNIKNSIEALFFFERVTPGPPP